MTLFHDQPLADIGDELTLEIRRTKHEPTYPGSACDSQRYLRPILSESGQLSVFDNVSSLPLWPTIDT
jgi:hypothetical protein